MIWTKHFTKFVTYTQSNIRSSNHKTSSTDNNDNEEIVEPTIEPVQEPVDKIDESKVIKLSDINGHWAEDNIKKLVSMGAVNGYTDGTFKPNGTITRAEFATLLIKAFGLELQSGKVFKDTDKHWAKDYIATAQYYKIVNGYDNENFGPDDYITREQMTVMIVKIAMLSNVSSENTFADSKDISNWAKDAVSTALAKGIISGYGDNTFRPKGLATRAEAVTIIINALK